MKDPLPIPFVEFLKTYVNHAQFTNVRRLHRGLILRWVLWQDGHADNALPGYETCPPAGRNGLPAGWSLRKFSDIAREAIGTQTVHIARRRAARL
jgi:hypothetical protein